MITIAMIEGILSILQIYFTLFNELILTPILNIIHRTPAQKDNGIPVNIGINTARHSPSSERERSRVKFGQLEIRTYESILGDNPSCSRGPPLAIGWNYDADSIKTMPVDVFENHPSRRDRPQIYESELIIDRAEREQTLLDLGYTKAEIAAATRQTLKDKRKRRRTADNLGSAYMEEKVEGFKKSLRRNFLLKKGTKKIYKDWKKVAESSVVAQDHHQGLLRGPEQDTWHRTQSILVLGNSVCSGSTGTELGDDILSQSTGEGIPDSITLQSTSKCKLSSVRRDRKSMRNHRNRRSSV